MKIEPIDRFYHYDPILLGVLKIPNIIEIGSVTGGTVPEMNKLFGRYNMAIWEASPESFDFLSNIVNGPGSEKREGNVSLHCKAVMDRDGLTHFHEYEHRGGNSVMPHVEGIGGELTKRIRIPCVTLENCIKESGFWDDGVDLLLANCEGSELFLCKEMIHKPEVRERIPQACMSFHIQSRFISQDDAWWCFDNLAPWYHILVVHGTLQYYLFIRKDIT